MELWGELNEKMGVKPLVQHLVWRKPSVKAITVIRSEPCECWRGPEARWQGVLEKTTNQSGERIREGFLDVMTNVSLKEG